MQTLTHAGRVLGEAVLMLPLLPAIHAASLRIAGVYMSTDAQAREDRDGTQRPSRLDLHEDVERRTSVRARLLRSGRREGYPMVARAIYRSLEGFKRARHRYVAVSVPVTLVYSDYDWSRPAERDQVARSLADVRRITLPRTRESTRSRPMFWRRAGWTDPRDLKWWTKSL